MLSGSDHPAMQFEFRRSPSVHYPERQILHVAPRLMTSVVAVAPRPRIEDVHTGPQSRPFA